LTVRLENRVLYQLLSGYGDGVEPTNNAMEQRFRFVVIDRKTTQGTRGEAGRR